MRFVFLGGLGLVSKIIFLEGGIQKIYFKTFFNLVVEKGSKNRGIQICINQIYIFLLKELD